MGQAEGFEWSTRKNGDVVISHRGRQATVLRDRRAVDFLDDVGGARSGTGDAADQELMARLTGNYKRGNEKQARNHPRNRGRR